MPDSWRRLDEHLRDASLYEDASARPAGVAWRRRILSRYAGPQPLAYDGSPVRRWLPAMLGVAGALTVLSLLWYYGALDGLLSRLNPGEMELGHRRPGDVGRWRLGGDVFQYRFRTGDQSEFAGTAVAHAFVVGC